MAIEVTFGMIKPDAVANKSSGKIIDMIENNGFEISFMQKMVLSKEKAREFYDIHKERPFFEELVNFISSGPVIALVLKKEDAVLSWRNLMGSTNPQEADEGTIRKLFGANIGNNAVHGSDSKENGLIEIKTIFPELAYLCE